MLSISESLSHNLIVYSPLLSVLNTLKIMLSRVILVSLLASISGFKMLSHKNMMNFKKMYMGPESGEVTHDSIALTGFLSKRENYAETYAFTTLFEKNKWKSITAVSDDITFARKRLVTPKSVYSGLIDILDYQQVDQHDIYTYEKALTDKDAWLAFNVPSKELTDYARLAAKLHMKRVVFAIKLSSSESSEENLTFQNARSTLEDANVQYTFLKYNEIREMAEAKYPYRIVRGELPLPNENPLSDGDLMRVITEVIDIPKTFNTVYGIGGGSRLDSEILIYMKSQGWPERVQVGLLMGDMMEKIEQKFNEEKEKAKLVPVEKPKPDSRVPI